MLCNFCNTARLDNEAPCQHCGAPSPFIGKNQNYGLTPPSLPWGGPISQLPNMPQQSFPQGFAPQQAFAPSEMARQNQPSKSLVPYQAPNPMQQPQQPQTGLIPTNPLMTGALMPAPDQMISALLPSLPEDATYIAPMYTKPRPIIPRYRVISGLLSVLIVVLLLCSGATYYAKASGKLSFLQQFYGSAPLPPNSSAQNVSYPNPKSTQDYGPGHSIINSAILGSSIDTQTRTVLQPNNIFKPGQTIYLNYTVQNAAHPGILKINWYTNNVLYYPQTPQTVTDGSGTSQMNFSQSVEGTVELYWNNQFAIRLYFVIRN